MRCISIFKSLWEAVAKLKFCLHFRRHVHAEVARRPRWPGDTSLTRTVARNQHMIVGRTVNVATTVTMTQYLEQMIDRFCRERLVTQRG